MRWTWKFSNDSLKRYAAASISSRPSWTAPSSPLATRCAGRVTAQPHSRMPSTNSALSKSAPAASALWSTADQFDCAVHSAVTAGRSSSRSSNPYPWDTERPVMTAGTPVSDPRAVTDSR